MTHEKAITISQLIIDNDNFKTKNELLENDLINAEMNLRIMTDEYTQTMELLKLAVEDIRKLLCEEYGSPCQFCKHDNNEDAMCCKIGGSGSWCCQNAKWQHADRMEAAEVAREREPK